MPIANRSSFSGAGRRGPGTASRAARTADAVDRLARFEPGDDWVVSCYLKLEPRDRARGKYLIKLKNRVRERLAWLDAVEPDRAAREAVALDLSRVRQYLEDPGNLPAGQGIAIFACSRRKLFEAIPLPRVFRSRLAVDRTPLVRELAAVADEFGRVICVAYDRTGARFFRVSAFDVEELPSLAAGETTRAGRFHGTSAAGRGGVAFAASGEHNYNQRIRVEKHRHHARIAERLFETVRDQPVRGIVLAGNGDGAGAVERHLHPYVARSVLGSARLNPKTAAPAEVLAAVLMTQSAAERQEERAHVRRLREGLGTGWAVNGIEATLSALGRGQVRTLLVDAAEACPGWRCRSSGRLTTDPGACRAEGGGHPVPDVIDEAIEEALRQHAHVDVIEDDEARGAVKGLGALLRFR